jgi:hypothetical protein
LNTQKQRSETNQNRRNEMTIKHLFYIFILANTLSSCADKTPVSNKYFGVDIKNYLPSGSVYTDTSGKQFGFRAISFEITNDTLIPAYFKISLPNEFNTLSPLTDNKFRVFLLPDSMNAGKLYQNNSFASKELELFLQKDLFSTTLNVAIQPEKTYKLRLGFLFSPNGMTRAEIFSKGHELNLYIPKEEIKFSNTNKNGLEIMLGVTLNCRSSDCCYSTISCGKLAYSPTARQ